MAWRSRYDWKQANLLCPWPPRMCNFDPTSTEAARIKWIRARDMGRWAWRQGDPEDLANRRICHLSPPSPGRLPQEMAPWKAFDQTYEETKDVRRNTSEERGWWEGGTPTDGTDQSEAERQRRGRLLEQEGKSFALLQPGQWWWPSLMTCCTYARPSLGSRGWEALKTAGWNPTVRLSYMKLPTVGQKRRQMDNFLFL